MSWLSALTSLNIQLLLSKIDLDLAANGTRQTVERTLAKKRSQFPLTPLKIRLLLPGSWLRLWVYFWWLGLSV